MDEKSIDVLRWVGAPLGLIETYSLGHLVRLIEAKTIVLLRNCQ